MSSVCVVGSFCVVCCVVVIYFQRKEVPFYLIRKTKRITNKHRTYLLAHNIYGNICMLYIYSLILLRLDEHHKIATKTTSSATNNSKKESSFEWHLI